MSEVYKLVNRISLQVNNNISDFILRSVNEYTGDESITVNTKMIVNAINKQTPKEPNVVGNMHNATICPSCCCRVRTNYCPECGQAIKWEAR